MNPFQELERLVRDALAGLVADGALPQGLDLDRVGVELPRDAAFGDAATNAAMLLAKPAGARPMELAAALAERLRARPEILKAEPAPPGFLNLTLQPSFWQGRIAGIIAAGAGYGRSTVGAGLPVNVEYCSANPTGPLHVGHGRGTVFGDALANLLEKAGFAVTREYYVNDGGAQVETLARSLHLRYREALGEAIGEIPAGLYPGTYLIPLAQAIARRDGPRWANEPEAAWLRPFADEAVAAMLALIREDLAALGVRHDVFTSERRLIEEGRIDDVLATLQARDLVYTGTLPPPKGKPPEDWEPVPQLLFRSSGYGDDSDRPLRRSTGDWTYFAADIAYHLDKFRRGARLMVDVWGADHGGYVKRMQAAVRAVTEEQASLEVRLCQLVNLLDDGKPLKMSKRAGRIVTLRDVVDEVGRDVVRFIMLTRKNDAPLDFDLLKVTEQSKDNPVFYVQYAHARICSVLRNAAEAGLAVDAAPGAEVALLADPAELALLRLAAFFPRLVEAAAQHREPHRVAFYLGDLAGAFHALWTRGNEQPTLRFIQPDEPELTQARLGMLRAVRQTLAAGLAILGVTPVEELR
ncbi:MAG: arginine--tRNA ligase [Geminicoccaceae bacterium]